MSNIPHLKVDVIDKKKADDLKLKFQKQQTDREKYEALNNFSLSGVKFQQFYTEFKNFYYSQKISSQCSDITFINLGSNPVTIDSTITLQQNQSLLISANQYELNVTEYDVKFSVYSDPNNNLLVIRKLYK